MHAARAGWSAQQMERATTEAGLAFPIVDFVAEATQCTACMSPLHIQKSRCRQSAVISIQAGQFIPREMLKVCSKDTTHPVIRSTALAHIVRPHQRFAYDIMVHVGLARYLRDLRREDIRAEVDQKLGVVVSEGSISKLCDRFLNYLEALHLIRAPYLRAVVQETGYALHLDATNDRGKGGTFVCIDGFRRWVLVAGKIPSEREDCLKPLVDQTVSLFGDPVATMRDLLRAGPNVVASTSTRGIPDLVCHFHWLSAVGKRLFDVPHGNLRDLLRLNKVRSDLRDLLGDLKRYGTADTYEGRFGPGHVREELLALVHWVLEGDGKKQLLYPFSLPYLECFHRCRQAIERAERWLPCPRTQSERRALRSLGSLVARVERDHRFANMAAQLEKGWQRFCELRDVLRLSNADLPRAGETPLRQLTLPAVEHERLRAIQQAMEEYIERLRDVAKGDHKKKPITPEGVILKYWDRYGHGLFGHPVLRNESGVVIAVVERTNHIPEHFFDQEKRHLRRRLGKAHLGRDLEDQPAQAFLATNLRHDDYVRVLCGSLDNLPSAFANLDEASLSAASPLTRDNRDANLRRRVRQLLEADAQPAPQPTPAFIPAP